MFNQENEKIMKKRIFSIIVALLTIASGAQAQTEPTVVTWDEQQIKAIDVYTEESVAHTYTICDITIGPSNYIAGGTKHYFSDGNMVFCFAGSIYFEHSSLPIAKIVITYKNAIDTEVLYSYYGRIKVDESTITWAPKEETKDASFDVNDQAAPEINGITKIEFTLGTIPHTHNFVWEWSYGAHWQTCTSIMDGICTALEEENWGLHCLDSDGKCTICGYSRAPHNHSYATTWSSDATTHWHACTSTVGTCNAPKADEAAHTFNSSYICTICGFKSNPPTPPTATSTIYNVPDGWKVNGQTPTDGKVTVNVGEAVVVTPTNIPAGKKIKNIKAVKKQ